MSRQEVEAVLDALGSCFASGDMVAMRELYCADAVIWHSHDGIEGAVDQTISVLGWIVQRTSSRSYRDVRRLVEGERSVEQHTVVLHSLSGEELRIDACIVVELRGGRISRLEEYIDPAPFSRLAAS